MKAKSNPWKETTPKTLLGKDRLSVKGRNLTANESEIVDFLFNQDPSSFWLPTEIDGNPKNLSKNVKILKRLESTGIVESKDFKQPPGKPIIEYRLTSDGREKVKNGVEENKKAQGDLVKWRKRVENLREKKQMEKD